MIQTVLGPIEADQLGVTSMHDHLLADSSRLQREGMSPGPETEVMTASTTGYLRWNQLALADNLRLDDADLAVEELSRVTAFGQRSMVDSTSWGLGPDHAGLPDVSRRSGVTVVCSYGTYIPRTLPPTIADLTETELEADLVTALETAIPGTGFRAGIIGIMGTSGTVADDERANLRAGARAAVRTGAAMTVRLDQDERSGLDVLALCAIEGLPAARVVFTNADEFMDAAYWADLAGAGAVLEMCFGTEASHRGRLENPSDRERLAFFTEFLSAHPDSAHTLGQSTWTKAHLRRFGGYGYEHLMARIVPELESRGISTTRLDGMLVDTPRQLLDRDAVLAS